MVRHNDIIDMLDRFAGCEAPLERFLALGAVMESHGSAWTTLGTAPADFPDQPDIRSTVPDALMADYMREKIYREDPWMRLCAEGRGINLLDVQRALRQRLPTPVTRRLCQIFDGYGVSNVALVPLASGRQSGGVVFYAQGRETGAQLISPDGLARMRLIAACFAATWQPGEDGGGGAGFYSARRRLAPREAEALCWLAAGMKTAGIADRMGVRDVTVSKHLASARRKLGARTREQALAMAVARGLIDI